LKNILFFGNSFIAGYGLRDAASESFPALIQQKINLSSLPYKVISAGLSGDSSAGGLNRIDYWISRPVDVFVLELGINDIKCGIPPQTTAVILQAVIDKVRVKYPQAKMILLGVEPLPFIRVPAAMQFREMYCTLARENKMTFVPSFLESVAGQAHLNLPDRIHPNAEGYKIIAAKTWPVIRKLLIGEDRFIFNRSHY
jgi:acyl-CoA thioesterase-1